MLFVLEGFSMLILNSAGDDALADFCMVSSEELNECAENVKSSTSITRRIFFITCSIVHAILLYDGFLGGCFSMLL